jgi:serine/threonine protein kinase
VSELRQTVAVERRRLDLADDATAHHGDEATHRVQHDTDPPPPGVRPGALISSRYDVKDEIGRGGFGTSWLAYDRLSGLDLVLKVPVADDGGAIRHELELAFQIVHPNICQAFPDRDDETGQPFLAMQHGGVDLRVLLERQEWRPFPLPVAIHVLMSIADALDYLHDKLILHLDVSPMNILIDDDDIVRLTDFGSSARARNAPTSRGDHTVMAREVTSIHHLWSAGALSEDRSQSIRSVQPLPCVHDAPDG